MSRYKSSNSSIRSHLSNVSLPKEEVNIVLLGKQNVGKSALVVKYLTKRFIREYDPFLEDTYWKPDTVDQQDVLVKVMDTYGKDDKRLPYYLKWADAVLITYSITQQDSFEMALAYLDAISSYSKSLTVSSNDLVLILLGNKLDLERTRVIPKSEGESIAAKFSCAFCETTAADDYEYVQQLFHRAVREVRKERERAMASNTIEEEPSDTVHFTITPESPSSSIPLPPPLPATLVHKGTKLSKPESQVSLASSATVKSASSTTLASTTSSATQPATTKRTSSKSSVLAKIFK